MSFCDRCGSEARAGARFCASCGADLPATAESAPPPKQRSAPPAFSAESEHDQREGDRDSPPRTPGQVSEPDARGLRSRARWVLVALVVVALLDLVALGSDIAEYRLLGTDFTIEEADANDLRQGVIGVVQFSLLILTAVLFIRWFKRAYETVTPLGGVRRYGTGWRSAAGSFRS